MIFVDTSFWVALAVRADAHHEAAAGLWKSRIEGLVTSNHIVGETWTFINRRHGHRAAVDFTDAVKTSPSLAVIHTEPEIENDAWTWLRRHDEREYSFVDATTFAYMRRHKIRTAYAFDGDFAAAGFIEARP